MWRRVPPKRQFTQDLHAATSQKTEFFNPCQIHTANLITWDQVNSAGAQISTSFSIPVPRMRVLYHNFYCVFSCYLPPN
jgi:hypothetical protein